MGVKIENVRMVIERASESALVGLDASPEALDDLREGRAYAYVVTVEESIGVYEWNPLGGPGLCLLDKPWWAGVYTAEKIDSKCPGPDANWLADQFEGVLRTLKSA